MSIQFRTRSKAIQPDPDSIGACCIYNTDSSSYDCSDNISYINCRKDMGIFRGEGSQCTDDPCPSAFQNPDLPFSQDSNGACQKCGSCSDNTSENDCITQENFDAEFFGGKTCTQVTRDKLSSLSAIKYACCVDGGCFDTCNSNLCSELGGIFHDGVSSALAQQCVSNPCGGDNERLSNEEGACCSVRKCLGTLTKEQCGINGGLWKGVGTDCNNYDCFNDRSTSSNSRTFDRQGSQSTGNIVCSIPTPKKYYRNGEWLSNVVGPTYGRESVIVRLTETDEECTLLGGIVSARDGNINKAIMWGGCQYNDGEIWKCESKTYDGCRGVSGSWQAGLYCDQIRSWPASGLYFSKTVPTGTNKNEKFLAGSCHLIDNVLSGQNDTQNTTMCGDMMTEYDCHQQLQIKYDYYLNVLADGSNSGWNIDTLTEEGMLEVKWRAGRKCSDCTQNEVPATPQTLGQCILSQTRTGGYYNEQGSNDNIDYDYTTGNQDICLDNYTKSDCDIMHGTWIDSCKSCITDNRSTSKIYGSCCTSKSTCLDNMSFVECDDLGGFFHGPDTKCIDRNCDMVAYLTTNDMDGLDDAFCKCVVVDHIDASKPHVIQVFARQDAKNEVDIWSGSTCGDPTVDAYPYYSSTKNFADNTLVSFDNPVDDDQKFPIARDIAPYRYNILGEGFRDFIVGDGYGSFIDDILVQNSLTGYFRVDGKVPFRIPYVEETLSNIRGVTLSTNQPADTIHRLILNKPQYYYADGPVPSDRRIKYINLEGMVNLRELAVQGNNWNTLTADFEEQTLTNLRMLDLRSSGLTSFSLANCPAIEELDLGNNSLTTLDLTDNLYITNVSVPYNKLTSLTIGNENLYLSRLDVSNNVGLFSITGSYPQLESFSAAECNLSVLDFNEMPYLREIDLTGNNCTTIKIQNCPSITEISLDSAISGATDIATCILPNTSNRNMPTIIPPIFGDAIIPTPFESLDYFSFRNNVVRSDGYDNFVKKLSDTIIATKSSMFTNTLFSSIGNISTQAQDLLLNCTYIDFSHVTDAVDDVNNPTNSSVLEILKYIFSISENTFHNKPIRINLTGINTSVHWDVGGSLRTALTGPLLGRINFIL